VTLYCRNVRVVKLLYAHSVFHAMCDKLFLEVGGIYVVSITSQVLAYHTYSRKPPTRQNYSNYYAHLCDIN